MAILPTGVPSLGGASAALFIVPRLLTSDTVSSILGFGVPAWGIYDQQNNPVITADNVVAFDYKKHWRLPDYPIEDGGFTTYDKVELPYDVIVSFSQGGSESDRALFLASFEGVAASLDLYNVVTPEITYLDANIEMYGYSRKHDRGVGLITVEVRLKEIRQTATQSFSQTASPAGADQVHGGNVQAQPVTPAQQSAISSLFGGP